MARLKKWWAGECAYCGLPGDTLDHIIPCAYGGDNSLMNKVLACRACNEGKDRMTAEEYLGNSTYRLRRIRAWQVYVTGLYAEAEHQVAAKRRSAESEAPL
nr:HNH endonuclease [Roseomonas acroporae]